MFGLVVHTQMLENVNIESIRSYFINLSKLKGICTKCILFYLNMITFRFGLTERKIFFLLQNFKNTVKYICKKFFIREILEHCMKRYEQSIIISNFFFGGEGFSFSPVKLIYVICTKLNLKELKNKMQKQKDCSKLYKKVEVLTAWLV